MKISIGAIALLVGFVFGMLVQREYMLDQQAQEKYDRCVAQLEQKGENENGTNLCQLGS